MSKKPRHHPSYMERIFIGIPNYSFHKTVKQYAFSLGKPVTTLKEMNIAFINYTYSAIKKN